VKHTATVVCNNLVHGVQQQVLHMCIRFVMWYIRTGLSCLPLLGRHAVVLVWPRTVRHRKSNGPRNGRTVRVKARTVRPRPGSPIYQGGMAVVLGRPRTVRQSKPNGPRMGRTVRAEARTVRPCSGVLICQAVMAVVVLALDMSSSAYHIMVGAANPHLLRCIRHRYPVTSFI
jgi:hypothetical protein